MVLAKRTAKNQLTLPKSVLEQVGAAECSDGACDNGRIVLTPIHPGAAAVGDAVTWARNG